MVLSKTKTGTWMPAWVPQSTPLLAFLLLLCTTAQTLTNGCDGTILNGFNILPSYNHYFNLTNATKGLNTAAIFAGGFLGLIWAGSMADRLGRRPAVFWGSLITIFGVLLQTAAQHVAMFAIARIVIGWGGAISGVASAVYLSETFPARWRAWGVGLLNNCYYIGAFLAALVTLGASNLNSTWSWRLPSLFQAVWSIFCIILLPFLPESPRWLIRQGLHEEARMAVAQTNSSGDSTDSRSTTIYRQIEDALRSEEKLGRTMSFAKILKTPTVRKRLFIGASVGPFSCIAGNVIASYYLGAELEIAGITNTKDQLKANVALNVWCFFCSLIGTQLVTSWGRKPTALLSQSLVIACLFVIGGLTKITTDHSSRVSRHFTYGNVAAMFLLQGFYSIAWTPLLYIYPPEIMNYPIRAKGLALSTLTLNALALLLVFVMPIAIGNIGWRIYMINGSWDIITLVLIAVFWIETKGKTLEEIDALFEDKPHPVDLAEQGDLDASDANQAQHIRIDYSITSKAE